MAPKVVGRKCQKFKMQVIRPTLKYTYMYTCLVLYLHCIALITPCTVVQLSGSKYMYGMMFVAQHNTYGMGMVYLYSTYSMGTVYTYSMGTVHTVWVWYTCTVLDSV